MSTLSIVTTPWHPSEPLDEPRDEPREDPISRPRRAVVWERRTIPWKLDSDGLAARVQSIVLAERSDGAVTFCAELGEDTPYFLELREGGSDGQLGRLLARLDLDGDELLDRPPASRTVLYGEAPSDVLVVAELLLDGGAYTLTRPTSPKGYQ